MKHFIVHQPPSPPQTISGWVIQGPMSKGHSTGDTPSCLVFPPSWKAILVTCVILGLWCVFFPHSPDPELQAECCLYRKGFWRFALCTSWKRGLAFTAFPTQLPIGRIFSPGSGSEGDSYFCSQIFLSVFLTLNSFLGGNAGGLGSIVWELALSRAGVWKGETDVVCVWGWYPGFGHD